MFEQKTPQSAWQQQQQQQRNSKTRKFKARYVSFGMLTDTTKGAQASSSVWHITVQLSTPLQELLSSADQHVHSLLS